MITSAHIGGVTKNQQSDYVIFDISYDDLKVL